MSKGKNKRKREHSQRQAEQKINDAALLGSEIVSAEESCDLANQKGHAKNAPSMGFRVTLQKLADRSSLTDWLLAIFTLALVVTSIYQMVILGGQLDTMRKDQRAWVSLSPASDPQISEDKASGNVTISWNLVLMNTGKTLARHSSVEIVVDTVRNGDAPTFAYDRGIAWQTDAVVFPNTPVAIVGKMLHTTKTKDHPEETVLTRTEYEDLLDGTQYLVVYAQSSYLDIFGKEHWQHFCGFKSLSPKPINVTARGCTNYNDVDNNN